MRVLETTLYRVAADDNLVTVFRVGGSDPDLPIETVAVIRGAAAAEHVMQGVYRAILLGRGNDYIAGLVDGVRTSGAISPAATATAVATPVTMPAMEALS